MEGDCSCMRSNAQRGQGVSSRALQGTEPRSGMARPLVSSKRVFSCKGLGESTSLPSFGLKSPYPSPRPLTDEQWLVKATLGLTSSVQPREGESHQQSAHLNVYESLGGRTKELFGINGPGSSESLFPHL